MSPPPPDLPGRAPRLADGRYVVLTRLASSPATAVFGAWDTHDEVWCAVEVLRPHATSDDRSRRFEAEARRWQRLSSPHLVPILDVGTDEGTPWIVTELVEAGSLHRWQEQHGAMPPRLVVDAGRQLCQGLTALHEAGAVHLDVHPRNGLIDLTGTVRLAGPGLGTGPPGFASPEQAHDATSADPRADLYALGATLWTLLTAREPHELFRLADRPERLDDVPIPLHDVLLGCLAPDREDRFGSAAEVQSALTSAWLALPQLPPGTPPLPLAPPPLELDHELPTTLAELVGRAPPPRPGDPPERGSEVDSDPASDEGALPAYLAGVEQAAPSTAEPFDGRGRSEPAPAPTPPARPLGALAVVPAALLGLGLLGAGALVGGAAVRLTASREAIDEAARELVARARTAEPVIDELRGLGGDPGEARTALDRLGRADGSRAAAQEALRFVAAAESVAARVATSDRHEARLVRQRLDRVRVARETLAAAWTECRATSEGLAGRVALATGLAPPACEPGGER